ncbi:hypothetical protein C7I55_16155 [Sphingomonas deserti]|uniref:Uncharacterized protein n=1 Tax=Allosphingosinicella deserti TaxID=2116704 RepID=A0A2P7QLN8_9SPHN|nr:hypothetical protein C7I55_16155 [Sphingomonas deserti]
MNVGSAEGDPSTRRHRCHVVSNRFEA